MMNSYTHLQMVQQNCQEETTNFEYPLQGGKNLQGVKMSVEKFKAESLNRQNQQMTLKPVPISGRSKVISSVANVPKE